MATCIQPLGTPYQPFWQHIGYTHNTLAPW